MNRTCFTSFYQFCANLRQLHHDLQLVLSWYTMHPDNPQRKLTAPAKDKLYEKLVLIYTGRGIPLPQGKDAEPKTSLRNIFKKAVKDSPKQSPRSLEAKQEIWNLYLDNSSIASKDIRSITSSDLMQAFKDIINAGTVSGDRFTENYFSDVKGCVHFIYKYAITFLGIPVTDLPKSLDYAMLPFRQTERRNDDILAKALTPSQFARAVEWCSENSDDLPVLGLWLNFYTALRFSELYALRWCDVSLKRGTVHVCGHMDKKKHRLASTKKQTAEGIRDIPLIPDAADVFRMILDRKPDDAKDTDLIFPLGGYHTYRRRCVQCFKYALETDTVPEHYVTHTVRSTAASLWYANGIDPKLIQRLLGHTTTGMTLRYCHEMSSTDKIRNELTNAMLQTG